MTPVVLPDLKWAPSPNWTPRLHGPVRIVVVHRPVGHYAGAIAAMCDPHHKAAAHVIVREDGDEATQLVSWGQAAWACAMFNSQTDNIETPDHIWIGPMTDDSRYVMRVCARVVAFRLHKRRLPAQALRGADILNKIGFARHYDLGAAGGGHSDPTTDPARWALFSEMVTEELDRGGFRASWGRI